jgi:hypothetical protein
VPQPSALGPLGESLPFARHCEVNGYKCDNDAYLKCSVLLLLTPPQARFAPVDEHLAGPLPARDESISQCLPGSVCCCCQYIDFPAAAAAAAAADEQL